MTVGNAQASITAAFVVIGVLIIAKHGWLQSLVQWAGRPVSKPLGSTPPIGFSSVSPGEVVPVPGSININPSGVLVPPPTPPFTQAAG